MSTETHKRQDSAAMNLIRKMHRRTFLKLSGAAVAAASVPSLFLRSRDAWAAGVPTIYRGGMPDSLETDTTKTKFVYSVCLQCHSACGIRGKVDLKTNRLVSIQGNPFHPNCRDDEDTRPTMAAKKIDDPAILKDAGTICPKGLAGVEVIYNPHRILTPLKRVGARGSGKWVSLTYEQAIKEIAAKLKPYWTQGPDPSFTGDKTAFLIDKDNPSLGYKNNQVALSIGRLEHGQKEFTDRWFKSGFGSVNHRLDHTSICETSHHVGLDLVFDYKKHHTKPDFLQTKFVLLIGANVLEAGFPAQTMSRKIIRAIKDNKLEVAVADPRFSKIAAKGQHWLPLLPATDAALCHAIARRWLDKSPDLTKTTGNAIDTEYLLQATKGAAEAAGQLSNSDATWLVRRDNGEYYTDKDGKYYVWSGGKAVDIGSSPHGNTDKVTGTLMTPNAGVDIAGVTCDSVFALLHDVITEETVDGWAAICGVPADKLIAVADKMASHGKMAGVEFYRGPVQNTNGIYNALACAMLNTLRGNYDHKGGVAVAGGGHWHEEGGKTAGQLKLMTVAGAYSSGGPRLDRAKADFAKYKGKNEAYPKRPWFPLAKNGVWQELIPSIGDMYPYKCEVLFSYWANPLHTTPGQKHVGAAILKDESKLPLHVCFDNDFGETACLADYIIPDTTFLERWSTPHTAPVNLMPFSGYRQPIVGAYKDPKNPKYNEFQAAVGTCWQYEDIWIGIALELSKLASRPFPGIGADGLAKGKDLFSAWDWYKQILENFKLEHNAVTGMKITEQDIIDHGGAFAPPTYPIYEKASGVDAMKGRLKFGASVHLYAEPIAKTVDYMVGKPGTGKFSGLPVHLPSRDINNNLIDDDPYQWPFLTVTYKGVQHKNAVTTVCPTLMMLEPENFIEMNTADGRDLGLETGDRVLVTSPTNAIGEIGKVRLTETVRPGVIAVSMAFGRWETSSKAHQIDGKKTGFDPGRGAGVCLNPVQRLDPVLGDVVLQDKIGGSCSYSETRVRITKVA